jgi:hypothetical protein
MFPFHIELFRTVVIINTVLFLFHISKLGIAIAADMVERKDYIAKLFEPGVKFFE